MVPFAGHACDLNGEPDDSGAILTGMMGCRLSLADLKAPCSYMIYTWALK